MMDSRSLEVIQQAARAFMAGARAGQGASVAGREFSPRELASLGAALSALPSAEEALNSIGWCLDEEAHWLAVPKQRVQSVREVRAAARRLQALDGLAEASPLRFLSIAPARDLVIASTGVRARILFAEITEIEPVPAGHPVEGGHFGVLEIHVKASSRALRESGLRDGAAVPMGALVAHVRSELCQIEGFSRQAVFGIRHGDEEEVPTGSPVRLPLDPEFMAEVRRGWANEFEIVLDRTLCEASRAVAESGFRP